MAMVVFLGLIISLFFIIIVAFGVTFMMNSPTKTDENAKRDTSRPEPNAHTDRGTFESLQHELHTLKNKRREALNKLEEYYQKDPKIDLPEVLKRIRGVTMTDLLLEYEQAYLPAEAQKYEQEVRQIEREMLAKYENLHSNGRPHRKHAHRVHWDPVIGEEVYNEKKTAHAYRKNRKNKPLR